MKPKNIYQGLALLAMALTTAACQNELNDAATQPQPGEKVNITIRATQSTTPQTRTSYEDKLGGTPIDGIVVKWEQNPDGASAENIRVFDYDDKFSLEFSNVIASKKSSLSGDGKSITFEGEVGNRGKYLAMYPADKCIYDNAWGVVFTDFAKQTQNCATPMKHLKDFDLMVGSPEAADKYDKFTFTHEATMIRFILSLPSNEIITKVSLSSTVPLYSRMYTLVNARGPMVKVYNEPKTGAIPIPSFDLNITGHTASANPLKAYMMIPPLDLSGATLTITVYTNNGTFVGTLEAGANASLKKGMCYTLQPTLTYSTVTVPDVKEGELQGKLNAIPQDSKKTELVLQGAINATDITNLVDFLNANASITNLDLSGITNITVVKGFESCTKVTSVILPTNANAIGDNAFKDCTKLTTVTQNETAPTRAATTRASMPKKVKTVGESAFEGCTSMTEMFLHSSINTIGKFAFKGCTSMAALVFEGTLEVGDGAANMKLGTDILANTPLTVKIILPKIADLDKATAYKKALGKPTYYNFYTGDINDTYEKASAEEKLNIKNYSLTTPSGIAPSLPGGQELGQ